MQNTPYFSIIIATYNAEEYLNRCIASVYNQSFQDFEILIKDNNSCDSTISIIKNNMSKVSYFNANKDSGIYNAWNICLQHVKGKYITFLGADDWYHDKEFLEKIYHLLLTENFHQNIIIHGGNRICTTDGVCREVFPKNKLFRHELTAHMAIRHPGSFYSRGTINTIGNFDENFKISGDHDYAIRCLSHKFIYYPFSSISHQIGGASMAYKNMLILVIENYKIRKKHNIRPFFLISFTNIKRILIYLLYRLLGNSFVLFLHKNLSRVFNARK